MNNAQRIKRYYWKQNLGVLLFFAIVFFILWVTTGMNAQVGFGMLALLVVVVVFGLITQRKHISKFHVLGKTSEAMGFLISKPISSKYFYCGGQLRAFLPQFGVFTKGDLKITHVIATPKKDGLGLKTWKGQNGGVSHNTPYTFLETPNTFNVANIFLLKKGLMADVVRTGMKMFSSSLGDSFEMDMDENYTMIKVGGGKLSDGAVEALKEKLDFSACLKDLAAQDCGVYFFENAVVLAIPGYLFSTEDWQNALNLWESFFKKNA